MPQMGVSVAEGTVVEWRKAVGDRVARDEAICAISTDKIDTDVEAPASGTLAEILVGVGTTVEVGTVLARIDPGGGMGASTGGEDTGESEAAAALEAPGTAGSLHGDTTQTAPDRPGNGRVRYSPVVMRIAAEHGIDLSQVTGTGRGGRVRKQDVLAVVDGGGAEEAATYIALP